MVYAATFNDSWPDGSGNGSRLNFPTRPGPTRLNATSACCGWKENSWKHCGPKLPMKQPWRPRKPGTSSLGSRGFAKRALDRAILCSLGRSEEHTSELQSLMRISYAVFCLKKKKHVCTTIL